MSSRQHIESLAVDAKGLARMLEVSIRHIRRLDAAGKLPSAVRLGKAKRWRLSEINEWLAAGAPDRKAWQAQRRVS